MVRRPARRNGGRRQHAALPLEQAAFEMLRARWRLMGRQPPRRHLIANLAVGVVLLRVSLRQWTFLRYARWRRGTAGSLAQAWPSGACSLAAPCRALFGLQSVHILRGCRAVQRDERFGLKGAGAGEPDHSSDLLSLTKELGLASVWTIDLAHLLHRHKLAVTMHTVTIGTNEDFSDMSFYEKELVEDGERVNRLFKCAADEGIAVVKHTLPLSDLREALLSRRALFIVLVDLRKLKCSRCWFRWNSLMSWAMDSFAVRAAGLCWWLQALSCVTEDLWTLCSSGTLHSRVRLPHRQG